MILRIAFKITYLVHYDLKNTEKAKMHSSIQQAAILAINYNNSELVKDNIVKLAIKK